MRTKAISSIKDEWAGLSHVAMLLGWPVMAHPGIKGPVRNYAAGLAGSIFFFVLSFYSFLFSFITFKFELQFQPKKILNSHKGVLFHYRLLGSVFSQNTTNLIYIYIGF